MTKNQFKQQYMEAMGWTDAVVTDEDLMLEYPVCVYHFADGTQVTAVCEEIPAEEVPEEESLENILDALFDMEAVSAQQETVLGFFAPGKIDGEDLPPVMDEDILEELLDALDDDDRVRVVCTEGVVEYKQGKVTVIDKDGKTFQIAADSVILSTGYRPSPLATKGVKLVGDCDKVGNLRTVIWQAWDIGMKI